MSWELVGQIVVLAAVGEVVAIGLINTWKGKG